jgi:hypothetical protein
MMAITIFFAMLGMLSPASRGALLTASIFLYEFLGLVSGYYAGRLYKTLKVFYLSNGHSRQICKARSLLARIWRGESHFSQKWPLANVGESGESCQHGLANVGESSESCIFLKTTVLASASTRKIRARVAIA